MLSHLRASLWLLVLTVVICCVAYPLVLWAFGQGLFPGNSNGSLVTGKDSDGKDVTQGSALIAQPFSKDWYFQPRPSAASYNATASSGSNWGPNNPKLRDRVARQLGPIVKYNQRGSKKDDSVQKEIEAWFVAYKPEEGEPPLVVKWAKDNPTLAGIWVKGDANKPSVIAWLKGHPEILAEWKKSKPDAKEVDFDDDKTIPFDDVVGAFFESWATEHPKSWPEMEEYDTGEKDDKGEPVKGKRFKAVVEGADLQATFFDTWLQAHPDADLEKATADMVLASGSGLDPHITLRNALSVYQLDRVAEKRAGPKGNVAKMREDIEKLVRKHAFTPLSGLIGEPLVNVLELTLALDKDFPLPPEEPQLKSP